MPSPIKLFTGTSNPVLAHKIAAKLHMPIGRAQVTRFSDGEIRVEVQEHVRGAKCVIIQSTSAPANDTLMELVLMADALRRSSAKDIYAVIPFLGYSRQDRRPGFSRVPISSRVVADMIQNSGIQHILTVDVHANQIQGFYNVPIDNISAIPIFSADLYRRWPIDDDNLIVVSPDVGGVVRAREFGKQLDLDLAIIDKRRPKANVSQVMNIIGDVQGKVCVLVDDMIDTAGTLCKAADALTEEGAVHVIAYCTHPVLSGSAYENIDKSTLSKLYVTDTIKLPQQYDKYPKVEQISVSAVIAETVERMLNKESISSILEY